MTKEQLRRALDEVANVTLEVAAKICEEAPEGMSPKDCSEVLRMLIDRRRAWAKKNDRG